MIILIFFYISNKFHKKKYVFKTNTAKTIIYITLQLIQFYINGIYTLNIANVDLFGKARGLIKIINYFLYCSAE